MNTGAGSTEAVRRQLEGTWDLVALEAATGGSSSRVPLKATGTLVYDEYGNLTIDAQSNDPAAPVAAREVDLVSFKGRAVVDAVNSELKLMNLTGNVDPNEVLSPQFRRRFAFEADTLRLSSFDDQGRVMAISTWRRRKE